MKQQAYLKVVLDILQGHVQQEQRCFFTRLVDNFGSGQKKSKIARMVKILAAFYKKWFVGALKQMTVSEGKEWKHRYFLAQAGYLLNVLLRRERFRGLAMGFARWRS